MYFTTTLKINRHTNTYTKDQFVRMYYIQVFLFGEWSNTPMYTFYQYIAVMGNTNTMIM